LGQTLQTLVGVPSSQPNSNAANTGDTEDSPGITDTFANDMLDGMTQMVNAVKADGAAFVASFSALPDFTDWLSHQSTDPRRQALWDAVGSDILVIIGVPFLGAVAIGLMLWPLRMRLRHESPANTSHRIALVLGLLFMRLAPAIVFIGTALLLLDQNETHKLQRFIVLDLIYAITAGFTARQLLRALFSPRTDQLRLLSFTKQQATYGFRWLSAFSLIIVYTYFFVEIATAIRLPLPVIAVFQNLLALILTTLAITVIVQVRRNVAIILRGKTTGTLPSFSRSSRTWLANHWHSLAITYLVISLIVTMLGIDNGVALLLRATVMTFIILVTSRLGFVALDRWTAPTAGSAAMMHRQILAFLLRPSIWVVGVIAIAATWGLHVGSVIATPSGQRVTSAFISVALTLFVLTVIYEILNASIERHLSRRDGEGKSPVASARARTLLPMVRNTIFIMFSGIAVLTLMSAVGINIGPLLAGAGVVGVAIGFGSQSLVKDFLTGLFIVVENTVAVGDVVKIGDFGGVVEALSIRTIRLRDVDGSLHILPFSEVSKITNMTKGFAYAVVDVGVDYGSDLDHVMEVLREIGTKLQEDPIFKRVILEPIEVMGIEKLGDSSITVRCRIRTRPGKQWDVKRLLTLRILQRFAEEKIELPYPTVTQIMKKVSTVSNAAQEIPPSNIPASISDH
jgi:small conductance mechanosensitive channel